MSFTSWLRNVRSAVAPSRMERKHRRQKSLRTASHQLHLELLEDRCVPAMYAVTDLGTLGGTLDGYGSAASDLNQAGQVVGWAYTADGFNHAFLSENGTMIDLGTLGGSASIAEGINDVGQVVGRSLLPDDGAEHAFLVNPQGGVWFQDSDLDGRNDFMMDLGTLNGSEVSEAYDINNAGQVAGQSADRAFLWDAANGMTDLGAPVGFTSIYSYASGINETGQVTGYVSYSDPLGGGYAGAFLWDATNGMTPLGADNAAAINDIGQVVGGQERAFLWTPDSPNGLTGSFTDLGMLPGATGSNATAINNAGQVVGSSTSAFFWDAAGGMVDLQTQVAPGSDATLQAAVAINDGGFIAVNGSNGGGEFRAFLLTPIPPGTPSISIADAPAVMEGNAGTVNATFTVSLSFAYAQPITVHYQTADASATAGSDYAAASGDVTFDAGVTSLTIPVAVIGDRSAEPNETFIVNLTTRDAYFDDGQGLATILDDEPSVRINDVTVTEGNTGTVNATFTVSLSAASDGAVTVQYASADQTALAGSDYQAAGGTVTFAAGETTRTIAVLVNGDTLGELDETFVVNLSSVDAHVADGQGTGTIVGDEPAFVWLNPWAGLYDDFGAAGDLGQASAATFAYAQASGSSDPYMGPETYDSMQVVFQRTFQLVGSPTGWNVTIDGLLSGTLFARSAYAPNATSSASAHVGIVRAATGTVTHDLDFGWHWCTGNGTVTVSAPGSRGGLVPDGTYTVTGWLQATATGCYEEFVGGSSSHSSCELDTTIDAVVWDNPPDISVSDATFVEGNSGAVTGYFTVALSNPWNRTVTVDFALADGSATLADHDYGYLDANRTVTFAPGVMQQTIAVQIYGDRKFEPNETFSVNLNSPINATIADGYGQGIILDEEPSISINDVTVTEGHTGTRLAAFTVRLSVAYDVPVTIGYATANGTATAGSDYQAASGTLTIPAGQTSGTITVLVNGDRLAEPNETFFVNLSNLNYGAIADGQGSGSIVDDEPRISISDVQKMEGNSGTTLFVFTVSLSAAYDAPVTVNFATSDDKAKTSDHDYQAQSGTLTFAPGETTKTITIVVYGDTKKEPKETFYLDLFGNSSNSLFTKSRGLGTILNDD